MTTSSPIITSAPVTTATSYRPAPATTAYRSASYRPSPVTAASFAGPVTTARSVSAMPITGLSTGASGGAGLPIKAGEHVVGERPISREELASSGNLIEGPASSAGRASYGASYGVTGAATPFAAPAMTSYTGSTALAAPSVMGATPGFNVPPGAVYGGEVAPAPPQYIGYSGGAEILNYGGSVAAPAATYFGTGTIAPAPPIISGSVAPAPAQYMGYAGGDIMTAPPAIMGSVAPAPPQYIGYAGTEIISAPPVVTEYFGGGVTYGGSYGMSRPLGGSITAPATTTVGTSPLLTGARYDLY